MLEFDFDKEAVKAALHFLQQRIPGLTKHQAFKLLYFADVRHLERYGRPITGDQYVAMEYGPVPSKTYDLVKKGAKGKALPPIEGDLDELSDSDLEILEEIVEQYGKHGFRERTDLSHDAAWKAAREREPASRAPQMPWSEIIRARVDHAEELLRYLTDD